MSGGIEEIDGEVIEDGAVPLSRSAAERLRDFVERIERLSDEIADLQIDRRDVKKDCKNDGFDMDLVNEVLRRRAMDPAKREKLDRLMPLYQAAIGDPAGEGALLDGGDLTAAPRLDAPARKKLAEADAWASGLGR